VYDLISIWVRGLSSLVHLDHDYDACKRDHNTLSFGSAARNGGPPWKSKRNWEDNIEVWSNNE